MNIEPFQNIHKGEVILFVGNGENLGLTPPENFDYPSIGVNEIHLYSEIYKRDWRPTYYTTVDRKNMREFGDKIAKEFVDIPKFIPTPRMDKWQGENFYRFKNNTGGLLWPKCKRELWQNDIIREPMIYGNISHVGIKLAYFMGAKMILIIGMQHQPHKEDRHFYGINLAMSADQSTQGWFQGYKVLCEELEKRKVKLLNISENTYVPENVIPRDNWENWVQ